MRQKDKFKIRFNRDLRKWQVFGFGRLYCTAESVHDASIIRVALNSKLGLTRVKPQPLP